MRKLSRAIYLVAGTCAGTPLLAQSAAPVTVTPQTLRPEQNDHGFRVDIPEAGGLTAPAGAEGLTVTLADAHLEGGFPEVAAQTDAVLAQLRGQRATLKQIYAIASEVEAIHARAGYVLARVAVPPQDLRDGGTIRLVVVDGYIEDVTVTGIPHRVRAAVAARVARLIGRRHLRLSEIEQPLLIANEVPGLTLKSTLARGEQPGAARLILEGTHRPVTVSLGGDNQLDPSLGRWSVTTQVALNSVLGLGEQIYGFASSGYQVNSAFNDTARERVLGGGFVLPLGDGRLTINPELTFSRTQPSPAVGAPPTLGTLQRYTFRTAFTLFKTRQQLVSLNGAIEQIDELNTVPSFGAQGNLSHDRYVTLRAGASYDSSRPDGSSMGAAIQISRGLGDTGGLTLAEAQAETLNGYSRQGAANDFTKLTLQGHGAWDVTKQLTVRLIAKAQTGFGKAQFRAEQFSLEGSDAASAYVGGVTAVDDGTTLRGELSTHPKIGPGRYGITTAPYLFAAGGLGRLAQPTAVEPGSVRVAVFGGGLRAGVAKYGLTITAEYAHGLSDVAILDQVDRVNISAAVRF